MTQRQLQLLGSALVGFVLTEIPVLTYELAQPVFDYKHLAIGLLGGLATFLNRFYQTRPEGLADLHNEAATSLAAKQVQEEGG